MRIPYKTTREKEKKNILSFGLRIDKSVLIIGGA